VSGHLAVVTVTYNSNAEIEEFLTSVGLELRPGDRVWVADNGSIDRGTLRTLVAAQGATLLEMPENYGYGGALNRVIAQIPTNFRHILVSNPDVRLRPGALAHLITTLTESPRVAAVGPRVLTPDGVSYPSARNLPTLSNGIGHALFGKVWPSNPWSRAYHATDDTARHPSGWLSGCCLLINRTAFDAVDGFDDGYFMYFEDVDLGYRLGKAGWVCLFDPRGEVVHRGAHSTTTESITMLRVHHESAYRYLSKRYHGWWLAPVRMALRWGLNARFALISRRMARRHS